MNKVSIIMPVYNGSKYLDISIKSVLGQTYNDYELIIIDDASKDNSLNIIKKYAKKDKRIKYISLKTNGGPGIARNKGLDIASGRFISYLDCDDIYYSKKLEKQLKFMKDNKYAFTCTSYNRLNQNGEIHNTIILPKEINYKKYLKNTILQTSCIMFDTKCISKDKLYMPSVSVHEDGMTWFKILGYGYKCYSMNDILSGYRKVPESVSSNKFKATKQMFNIYYKIEKIGFLYSCYCFLFYAFNATKKRICRGVVRFEKDR